MKQKSSKANRSSFLGIVCMTFVLVFGLSSCRPDYDLDTTMPANLGSSIYKFLQDEGFDTYVQLIDDLGYKNVLAKTGSKTLFVADEEAVQRFYESGVFTKADGSPVTCYEDLSLAQKKMILYGSMLNNVYQAASLSTTEGPSLGTTMRRDASGSIYDTLPILTPADMPVAKSIEAGADYWKRYRRDGHNIMTFAGDMSEKPMVVFTPKFMQLNKMNSDDFDFLFNIGEFSKGGVKPGSQPNDVTVNGVKIISQNNRCFNGFVHVMEEVIYSLPNMSDYLRSSDEATVYNALLQRFSTLEYVGEQAMTELKDVLKVSQLDSVYEYRFFAERGSNVTVEGFTKNYDNVSYKEVKKLLFDPSWNAYNKSSGSEDAAIAMQKDMAVMLVPTDEAMLEWWNGKDGQQNVMKESFGISSGPVSTAAELIEDMKNLPDKVVVELIRNNQLNSLVNSVPSMFEVVMDDASDPMGIETSDVERVAMCCNGAIYFTNRVFSPAAYRAVSYPALVLENFEIIHWAIENLYFSDYLKSMQAEYSFFIPRLNDSSNPDLNGKLVQINPLSFNNFSNKELGMCEIAVFSYDDQLTYPVTADLYEYNYITREVGARVKQRISETEIESILTDLLDYHIVVGLVEETDYQYYQTKGRGTVMIGRENGVVKKIYGGFELDNDNPVASNIVATYDMKKEGGNGVAYIIDAPIHPSKRSVYEIVTDEVNYPEFSEFAKLMSAAAYDGKSVFDVDYDGKPIGSPYNVSQFNTYHYTVYVPTNESILQAIKDGVVISSDSIESFENKCLEMLSSGRDTEYENYMKQLSLEVKGEEDPGYTYQDHMNYLAGKIMDFVKYHIQDNSVIIGGEFSLSDEDIATNNIEKKFETAYFKKDNTFATLTVNPKNNGEFTIVDETGNIAKVVNGTSATGKSLNNIMCCEYVYEETLEELYTSSYAVIHQIDKPLIAK